MSKSIYPGNVDNDVTLPQVRNGATEIRGDVTNSLKSAILAVEKTLGINPQGTQPTVVDRLNVSTNSDGTIKQSALVTTAIADRNLFLTDGGLINWDISINGLTWDDSLRLRFPGSSGVATQVDPTTIFLLAEGDILYIEPSRTGADPVKTAQVGNLNNNAIGAQDIVILAVRDGDGFVHWRNGTVMSPNSTLRFGGTIAENVFFDSLDAYTDAINLQDAVSELDAYAFAIDRDRNLSLVGDAYDMVFDSGSGDFSWTGDFVLHSPLLGGDAIIRDAYESPFSFIGDGYVAVALLDQTNSSDYFATVQILNDTELLDHDKDSVVLAVRDGDKVHLRNGQVVYNPTAPVKLGEQSANHIAFDDSLVSFTASTVDGALSSIDSSVATISSGLTTVNNNITTINSDLATANTKIDQDRNTYMMGGGDFQYNGGTGNFTFTQTIRVFSPTNIGDALVLIGSSPINLPTNRSVAYITLNRSASIDYTAAVTVVAENLLPTGSDIVVIATRIDATKLLLKNGQIVFSGDDAIEHGESDGSRVTFDPTGTALSSTNMQAALAELDAIVTGLGSGSLPSGTIIMFNGGSCPAGTTAVAGITGAYPKSAATANLTPVGSNTHDHGVHTHTGSALSAGSHSHSLSGGVLTGHGVPPVSFSNLGFGSAAEIGHGHDGSSLFGSASSAGSHSHTLSVVAAAVPVASSEPLNFSVLYCIAT